MLISGEVEMCSAYNGRIFDAAKEGAPIRVCWECGHIINLSGYALPNGMKELYPERYELANLYMAWISFPEINSQLSKYISYGPVNRKAIPLLDAPNLTRYGTICPLPGQTPPTASCWTRSTWERTWPGLRSSTSWQPSRAPGV